MKILKNNPKLTTLALMLLITGAIDSIRNLPTTALFGSSLIFFFIMTAVVFLIPVGLVSAELFSHDNEKGGIYHWTQMAFGEKTAFLSVWLQWINTMVWFPTVLSFIAGTATYFVAPELAQNKIYLIATILIIFWTMTWVNLKGVHTSVKFANICSIIGIFIPMALIIGLAIIWVLLGKPLQIHFTTDNLLPSFHHLDNWISLTAIMSAFLGMELATVHVKEINQAYCSFTKALSYSILFILFTMIMGSLAIALVLPKDKINLTVGIMQAFTNFFAAYHMTWMIPIITVMLLIGSVGSMTSWIISPAKGLLQAAKNGYLPPFLTQTNQHGVASHLLILQAVLVTFVCLAFLLMPSVNGSYWLLTDLSTQLYVLMYIIMFAAAICLKPYRSSSKSIFSIPGGKMGTVIVSLTGIIGCIITLIVGFIPPQGINVGSTFRYTLTFSIGIFVMIFPVVFFYMYKAKLLPWQSKQRIKSRNGMLNSLQGD